MYLNSNYALRNQNGCLFGIVLEKHGIFTDAYRNQTVAIAVKMLS